MQTLVFNTTTKTVKLYKDVAEQSELLYYLVDCPTVKCIGENMYYEIMQKVDDKTIPVLRVPISNTNMVIEK